MEMIPSFVLDSNVQHRELQFAEHYAPLHGGMLPNDAFWRYVEARFEYAEDTGHLARFSYYHPVIRPLLEANERALEMKHVPVLPVISSPVTLPPSPVPVLPPVAVVPAPAPGPMGRPAAVPEPAALIPAGFGLAAAILLAWWRR